MNFDYQHMIEKWDTNNAPTGSIGFRYLSHGQVKEHPHNINHEIFGLKQEAGKN